MCLENCMYPSWAKEKPNVAGFNLIFLKYLCKVRWNVKNKLENIQNIAVVSIGNYSVIQQQYIIHLDEDFKPRSQYILHAK
jgi:hypothetical protein